MSIDALLALLPHIEVIMAFFVGIFVGVTLSVFALPSAVDAYVAYHRGR